MAGVEGTAGISAVAAGSPPALGGTRPGPVGGTRLGPVDAKPSCPAAATRSGVAGEAGVAGVAGEPVGRVGRAVTCGMYAVGESASGGVEGPEGAGRVGALPGAAGRTGPWLVEVGRPGVPAGGTAAPPCGPDPGAAVPGQGGGASALGRPGVSVGSGRLAFGRVGCSVRGGCSTGSGQLPAGVARPGADSGLSNLGRKAVGSSV